MHRTLTSTTFAILAVLGSMGAFCAPSPQPQPATNEPAAQSGSSDTDRALFAQQYEGIDPTISEYISKIELQEAEYQDWHARVSADKKKKATYDVVVKQHDDLVSRTEQARADYQAWGEYYEAHKETGTRDEQSHLSMEGQKLQQVTIKVFSDYGQLKTSMMQIAPLQ